MECRWHSGMYLGLAGVLLVRGGVRAGVVQWDPSSSPGIQGGSGVWNRSSLSWDDGATRVPWTDGSGYHAVFSGTAGGEVWLQVNLTAGSLTFDVAGYALRDPYELRVMSGSVIANMDAAINVSLNVPGTLVKSGAGVLSLGATNTIGAGIQVLGGTLSFGSDPHLGNTSNDVRLTGGSLRYAGGVNQTLASGRTVVVDAEGGSIDVPLMALSLAGNGQLSGPGVLEKTGAGKLAIWGVNSGFSGSLRMSAGTLTLYNASALNGAPIALAGGMVHFLGDSPRDFGSDVTVTGDGGVFADRQSALGMVRSAHQVGNVRVNAGATLTVSGGNGNYLMADALNLAGTLRVEDSGLKVPGSVSGTGLARFGATTQPPEAFSTGLLLSGAMSRTFGGTIQVDDVAGAKGIMGVEGGGVCTFEGVWQGGGGSAQSHVVLRGGSTFVLGTEARVNTTNAGLTASRPWRVVGTGPGDVLELGAGFVADRTAGGTLADGLGAIDVESATLLSRSSAGLPMIVRNNGAGGTVRAGAIVFSGTNGARWLVAGAAQGYDGQVTFNKSATVQTEADLAHTGNVASGFDAQFQAPAAGVSISKTGNGWLNLSGSQGYVAGTIMNISAGGVRFGSDPGAGFWSGNFTRNADGSPAAIPAPAGTLAVALSGSAGASVEFGAAVARVASLSIGAGTAARVVSGGGRCIVTKSLTIDGTGKLDLGDGRLVVDWTGSSAAGDVRALLKRGLNEGGARWQGDGIASAAAQGDASLALGYGEASDVLGISGAQKGMFGGAEVDATSVLVRLTVAGDCNLDGDVGFADLVAVAQNYGGTGIDAWTRGDVNYDGDVNFADLVVVAQNYGSSLSGTLPAEPMLASDWDAAMRYVPEPGGLMWVIVGMGMVLRRRRRA